MKCKMESITDVLTAFEDDVRHDPEVRSEKTRTWYVRCVSLFGEWCEEGHITARHALKRKMFEAYVDHLKTRRSRQHPDRTLSPATVDAHIRALKRLGKWARKSKLAKKSPARTLRLVGGTYKPPEKAIPNDEAHAFIMAATRAAANEYFQTGSWRKIRDLAMLLILGDSGARIGEVMSMKWETTSVPARRAEVNGKTGQRTIYFHELAAFVLKVYRDTLDSWQKQPGQPVWWSYDPRKQPVPIKANAFRFAMQRLEPDAGHKWRGTHRWRHAFAASVAEAGIGDIVLSQLMGHSNLSTTKHYARLGRDALQRVFNRLNSDETVADDVVTLISESMAYRV